MNIAQAQAKFLREGGFSAITGTDRPTGGGGLSDIETTLAGYASRFLTAAADNLNKTNSISTGELEKSLDFNIEKSSRGLTMNFTALDYYKFVDKGVRGSGRSLKNNTSPYKYKDKQPPVAVIEKWIIKNRLTATRRDVNKYTQTAVRGRTNRETKALPAQIGRRDLAFLIARAIKRDGLYATNFWQDAFDKTFGDFAVKMSEALGKTITVDFKQMAEELKSKKGTKIPR